MNTFMRSVALLAGVAASAGSAAGQVPDPRIEEVFATWAKQRARFTAIEYRVSGTATVPAGVLRHDDVGMLLPVEQHRPTVDDTGKMEILLLLDLAKIRFRREAAIPLTGGADRRLSTRVSHNAFDGTQEWNWLKPEHPDPAKRGRTDVHLATGNLRAASFGFTDWPMFLGLGIVPTDVKPLLPNRFSPDLDPTTFYIHGHGVLDGARCLVIRTVADDTERPYYLEYWIDPQQAGLVRRVVTFSDRVISTQQDVTYAKHESGHWLPRSWVCTLHTAQGKPFRIERLRVDSIRLPQEVKDSDFELALEPGMTVSKFHVPGDENSIVLADRTISRGEFVVGPDGRLQPISGPAVGLWFSIRKWVGLLLLLSLVAVGGRVAYSLPAGRSR